jgi:mannose-6-phosphate isomerase-like protein (cupin superfamily)
MEKINLLQKFSLFSDLWSPKVIAELNGQSVKLSKLKGEFFSHNHENDDELFLIVKGSLRLVLPEGEITLNEGELFIVPKGVEHKPIADEETWVLLFEPISTLNTGNVRNERTLEDLDRI